MEEEIRLQYATYTKEDFERLTIKEVKEDFYSYISISLSNLFGRLIQRIEKIISCRIGIEIEPEENNKKTIRKFL